MNHRIRYSTLSLLMLFALWMPAQGRTAALMDFSGSESSLSDHTGGGKWLIVMLWVSYCHVCNEEAHQYNRFHENHIGKDASVLGISMDGAAGRGEAEAFIQRHGIDFPNLLGEHEEIADLYQELTGTSWVGTPSFLIYDPNGKLAAKQEGAVPVHLIEAFISKSGETN